jgi:hypothetical protein
MCAANASGGYDGRALRAAFTESGQKLPTDGSGSYYLYYIDNRPRGHEVVVAFNNNKAAEYNVWRRQHGRKMSRAASHLTSSLSEPQ